MHVRKLAYLVLVCVAALPVVGVELVDGTNVWIGAASGGSWTNSANWRAESANGYSVEELFARYTVYDLRALAPGAVVDFDYADGNVYNVRNTTGAMFISGIILSGGPDDVWTIARSPEAARVHFTSKADICIDGGRLDFHPLTSTGFDYPTMPLVKKGTGTFRICQNNAFFWEVTHSVQGGCVSLTNNYNLRNCGFRISDGARLAVDFGSNAVAGVSSDAGVNPATTRIDIAPGATLELMSGFNVNAMSFGGDLTGTGKLRVSGGKTYSFTHGGNSNPLSFAGLLSVASGDLAIGTSAKPTGVAPTAIAEIEGGGWLRFSAGQRLASLSGGGVDGGTSWPAGETLTVEEEEDKSYSGRLAGGTFAKAGAGTLALDGEVACGDVRINEGTLAIRRGFYREGLAAAWRFEDEDDIGADATPSAAFRLVVRQDSEVTPEVIDGGLAGKALHFGGTALSGGRLMRADGANVAGVAPSGHAAFTFSFWMKPESGCGKGPNFIHVDQINTSGTLNWGNGFYFGSVMDGNTQPFKALGFYTCGWSRDGKKNNTNKVAVATFERSLVDGDWHHVVGTYSNRVMCLYVDGELRDTVTRTSDLAVALSPGVEFGVWSPTDANHKYAGYLDEVQWLRGAWSADEVRREYQARRPARDNVALLPAPTAHWTFDVLEDDGDDKVFRDCGPHRLDLVSVPSNGTHHAVLEAMSYPEDRGSKAARLTYATSHIRLRGDGGRLAAALPRGGSFTVALRSGTAANGVFAILGDGTASGSLRFSHEQCPRVMGVYPCASSAVVFGVGGVATSTGGSTWFLHTVVYDADAGTVSLYEDGVLCKVLSGRTLSFAATDLVLGASVLSEGVASTFRRNVAFDDLRIWNRALDPSQVKTLARTFRAQEAEVHPVLLPTAEVEVLSGARLRVLDGEQAVESVSGTGSVELLDGATLAPQAMTNAADFVGLAFEGEGTLRLPDGISFERDGALPPDRPVFAHAGRVALPERGRVVFTRSSASEPPAVGLYPLISAGEIELPSSWGGWTVEPACEGQTIAFVVEDGLLAVRVGDPDRVWVSSNARLNISSLNAYFHPRAYSISWSSYEGGGSGDPDAEGRYAFTVKTDGTDTGPVFSGTFLPQVTASNAITAVWTMTPDRDVTLAALAVGIEIPIAEFGGGSVKLDSCVVALPVEQGSSSAVARRTVSDLKVYDREGTCRLRIAFHSPMSVLVQDNRFWNGNTFSLRIMPAGGTTFTAGVEYTFGYDITLPGKVEYGSRAQWKAVAGERWIPVPAFRWIRPGTALDFSALRGTDAPAGRHGHVVCRGRHFEFEDLPGVPQRFYGVNICQGANVPSGNEAVFAANLARMGYNAIRYHHHDAELVRNTGDPGATALNPTMMDRFDRLVAACVTNGIYVTTDLFVSRSPITWRSLGFDRNGSLATADMKKLVLVHEPAFSNLVAFTRNFLGHVNPYLGRSLAHEPAMIGISFVNEGAISGSPAALCEGYPPWRDAWEAWLAAKKVAEPATYGSVSAEPPSSMTPFFCRFVQEREQAFAARIKAVVRGELGCQAPLTSLNGTSYPLAYMEVRASAYDYADDHFYVDHPSFLETKWQLPSSLQNKNPLKESNCGVQACSARRLFDRPYTVTEFNFSGPGRYRGVGGMATGALGAVQDWSGIWRFAWSHGEGGITSPQNKTMGFFDVSGDPLSLSAERAAICLYLRRDLPVLEKAYIARVPPDMVAGPVSGNTEGMWFPCRWAGWHAQLGYVVSNAVPEGAIDAGAYPGVKSATSDTVRNALGLGDELPAGVGGALDIDPDTGAFRIDTSRTSGGFAERGSVDAGTLAFELEGAAATVWASSLDGLPLRTSRHILLTHLTDVQNTNITYADDTLTTVLSWGKLPHLMRSGAAHVRLRVASGTFTVHALASDGERLRAVPATFAAGALSFTADVAATAEATWLYEIVRQPSPSVMILR